MQISTETRHAVCAPPRWELLFDNSLFTVSRPLDRRVPKLVILADAWTSCHRGRVVVAGSGISGARLFTAMRMFFLLG